MFGFFVCKFALVRFYKYFLGILTILQVSFIFQTPPDPPRPPQAPPQDPLGPSPGLPEPSITAGRPPYPNKKTKNHKICPVDLFSDFDPAEDT